MHDPITSGQQNIEQLTKRKQFSRMHIILVGLFFVVVAALFYVTFQYHAQTTKQANIIEQTNKVTTEDEAFITHIPNFDILKTTDLPNFVDVRGVYDFNGNKIITGSNRIIEYDPRMNTIIRMNNPATTSTIYSTALVGHYLYIVQIPQGQEFSKEYRKILKVNLETGKIVKTYFGDPKTDKPYINLNIVSKGDVIWAVSWDGLMKIDTKDDSITEIDYKEIGISTPECLSFVFNQQGKISVAINCADGVGLIDYDEKTNTWHKTGKNFSHLINLQLSSFGLDLPTYYYVSNRIADTYYLFSNKGIHTVKRGEFPSLIKASKEIPQTFIPEQSKAFTTKDGKYALITGMQDCMAECELIEVIFMDIASGKVLDTLAGSVEFKNLSSKEKEAIAKGVSTAQFIEEGENIAIISNGRRLAVADTQHKKLLITLQSN